MTTEPIVSPVSTQMKEAVGPAGMAIRDARLDAGLTLSQLAAKSGISKSQISAIERGRANVTLESLERLAAALGGDLRIRVE